MFVKVKDGQILKYPYTVGMLRRDNPNTSFPKNIPLETLAEWGVFPVFRNAKDYDPAIQVLVWDKVPTLVPHTDITLDAEGNEVSRSEEYMRWEILSVVEGISEVELSRRAAKFEAAKAKRVRKARNAMLAATDWEVIKGLESGVLPESFKTWRQALRDLPDHVDFPNVTLPVRPE